MRSVRIIAMLLGLATSACVDTPRMGEPAVESSHVSVREVAEAPVTELDLLIVIDDTAAMAPYRDRLALASDALAGTLDELARNWTDFHVAVVANDGRLRRLPSSDEAFLVDSIDFSYSHEQNYPGTLHDAVTTLMNVGPTSTGPSQPLEAIRRALESHSDFVRDNSILAIVTIGATDDASPWPVDEYIQWTRALTGGSWHRHLVAVGINVAPTPRLDEYFAAVSGQPITSIEDGDFAAAFLPLGSRWVWGAKSCLDDAPLDIDPATPGLQADCSLHVVIADELRPVPACHVTTNLEDAEQGSTIPAPACWTFVQDRANCWYEPILSYALELHGYTSLNHPAFRFECVVGE